MNKFFIFFAALLELAYRLTGLVLIQMSLNKGERAERRAAEWADKETRAHIRWSNASYRVWNAEQYDWFESDIPPGGP